MNWPFNLLKPRNDGKNSFYSSPSNGLDGGLGVLTDQEESDPISPDDKFHFSNYSAAICDTIRTSDQKFTVGIYSEWGTGKTTLMRLMEMLEQNQVIDLSNFQTKRYKIFR